MLFACFSGFKRLMIEADAAKPDKPDKQLKPKLVPANVSQLLQQSVCPRHPSRHSVSSRLSMRSVHNRQKLQRLLAETPREA